ncbi:unnamed protein product [Choristocarpus tenellus]
MNVATNRPLKIVMDQTLYFVTKCSMYIALVGLLRGDSVEEVCSQWKRSIKPVVTTGWKFWPLAHVVTYGFVPARHRVLWVNSVDLLWSSILAGMSNNKESSDSTNTDDVGNGGIDDQDETDGRHEDDQGELEEEAERGGDNLHKEDRKE